MHILLLIVAAFVAGYLVNRAFSQRRTSAAVAVDEEPAMSEFEALVSVDDFDSLVLRSSHRVPVMVDFFASWCPPCHHLGPRLAEFARDYAGAFLLAKVDVDAAQSLAAQYSIQSMPTVLLFRDGKVVDRFVGAVGNHTIRFFLAKHGVKAPEAEAPST